jgi:hypothetical protein
MNTHDDLRMLASGIHNAIAGMNNGNVLQFMLVVIVPKGDGEVTINTITAITDPQQVAQIGQHLIDMSRAQLEEYGRLVDDDSTVEGHA